MTNIKAVRSAFPAHRYRQAELTTKVAELSALGPDERALLQRLHGKAGVDYRHTALPLQEYSALRGIDVTNDRYLAEAADLGEQALRGALEAAGLTGRDLDILIVTSVTGVAVPSLDARLIPRLGLRPDIKRLPIFGLGCVAGAAALSRLHDYLLAWPRHHAALLAVELCSMSWPMTDMTVADLVVTGLFGDGAAALVAGGGQAARGLRVVATHSEVYPESTDALGWRLSSDGFRIVLSADLADVVERHLAGTVTAFLSRHGLTVDEITVWVCHPGGPRVIDAVAHALKLPDSAVEPSRRSLAEVGNVSSVSVLHILEQTIGREPPAPGSVGVMIGLGPGVSVELVLLQW
jgi:alkylresorcinol/alkylpyrone synthase